MRKFNNDTVSGQIAAAFMSGEKDALSKWALLIKPERKMSEDTLLNLRACHTNYPRYYISERRDFGKLTGHGSIKAVLKG